jgi:hypothetical protein
MSAEFDARYFTAVDPDVSAEETARQRRAMRHLGKAFVSPDSYGLVIVLVIVTYTLMVSIDGVKASVVSVFFQLAVVWFVFRTSRVAHAGRIVGIVIGLAVACAAIGQVFLGWNDPRPSPLVPLASAFLYLVAVFVILRNIVSRPTVDMQAALGAVAAYMCLGLFFAFTYRGIGLWQLEPFFGAQGRGTTSDCAFFSMTTLTTTGYGNLVPARNPGQSIAVLEMVSGQLFLLAAVGKVLADMPARRRRAGEPDS